MQRYDSLKCVSFKRHQLESCQTLVSVGGGVGAGPTGPRVDFNCIWESSDGPAVGSGEAEREARRLRFTESASAALEICR